MEVLLERAIISAMGYPALLRETVRAPAKFPAPTIVTCGFDVMRGRIAELRPCLVTAASAQLHRCEMLQTVLYIVCMAKSSASRKNKAARNKQPKERLLSSRTVYRGPVFWVTTDQVLEPGGIRVRRDLIHHSGSVVVLAVDKSGSLPRLLLERQYRHAAKDFLWELPAGRIDPGENELKAAKRELLEETGYSAAHWRRILKFFVSPGFVAETMSVYLATGLLAGKAQPEEDEIIYKRFVPLNIALRMVDGGTIRDAKTITSVLWLQYHWTHRKGSLFGPLHSGRKVRSRK